MPGLARGTYLLMVPNESGVLEVIARNINVAADGTDIDLGDMTIH